MGAVPFNSSLRSPAPRSSTSTSTRSRSPRSAQGGRLLRRLLRRHAGGHRLKDSPDADGDALADLQDAQARRAGRHDALEAIQDIDPADARSRGVRRHQRRHAGPAERQHRRRSSSTCRRRSTSPPSRSPTARSSGRSSRRPGSGGVRPAVREGQPAVPCVNQALGLLRSEGTLAADHRTSGSGARRASRRSRDLGRAPTRRCHRARSAARCAVRRPGPG